MNILITSASRKVSLVKSFQKALRLCNLPGKVIAVDINPYSASFQFADEHYTVPRSDSLGFIQAMLDFCEEHAVNLLIPTRDEELPIFSEHKQKFRNIGTEIMISDLTAVKTCQDKKLFNRFCDENKIGHPTMYASLFTSMNIKFPIFAKPRYGKGSKDAMKISTIDDLAYVLRTMPDAIVQEFINAPEYTVDLFSDFSGNVISVVPRQRINVFGGESFITTTVHNETLIQESIFLSKKLRLIGHNTIQCFFDGVNAYFIEVNPRFGGAANCSFNAGAFTPLYLVRLMNGEKLESEIGKFHDGMTMLRYTEDCFINAPAIIDDEGDQVIAIDFDRVIHSYSKGWHDGTIYDGLVDGAGQALMTLIDMGYKPVIFSARSNINDIRPYLSRMLPEIPNIEVTNIKPAAKVYIDDKALKFTTWDQVLRTIQEDTWNQNLKISS